MDPELKDFAGTALAANAGDIADAAKAARVGLAEFKAVLAVETCGHPFDAQNRPKMLFEPHVFYRRLAATPAEQMQACACGLAYPSQGTEPYPADSYPRLAAACEIDQDAALKSASWGVGQVMGMNFKLAGCDNVLAMVLEAMSGEREQLLHVARFIVNTGLWRRLSTHNWVSFAEGYNGRGQARNGYAVHLAAAYARFAAHPSPPNPAPIVVPAHTVHEMTADELNAAWLAAHPHGVIIP